MSESQTEPPLLLKDWQGKLTVGLVNLGVWLLGYFSLNKFIEFETYHEVYTMGIDELLLLPLGGWTIFIYNSCYINSGLGIFLLPSKEAAWRFLGAILIAYSKNYAAIAMCQATLEAILEAVDAGTIARKTVSIETQKKLLLHNNKSLTNLVRKHFGQVAGATTQQMQKRIEELNSMQVTAKGAGNPYTGKRLYRQTCGKCHTLFTEGGKIGPNLTGFKRDDIRGILMNVINPSAEIRKGFENYTLVTCLLYTSPSPRDATLSRMPSSA